MLAKFTKQINVIYNMKTLPDIYDNVKMRTVTCDRTWWVFSKIKHCVSFLIVGEASIQRNTGEFKKHTNIELPV